MFALPGSAYLYQGEELGLQEVGSEIPDSQRQDPAFFRNKGVEIGRDGCRVPLPWTASGTSFGFGTGGAHLPQPEWFASYSVEAQELQEDSTLSLYRRALALRSQLQTAEALEWLETGRTDVLAFRRPNGWISVTNFGTEAFGLPDGEVLVSSSPLMAGSLPGATTAWLQA
jgi:alpha-glucosidase